MTVPLFLGDPEGSEIGLAFWAPFDSWSPFGWLQRDVSARVIMTVQGQVLVSSLLKIALNL